MFDEVMKDAEARMKKAVEAGANEFGTLRTGRASPSLVDGLKVDYYGSSVPLSQVASISIPEARQIEIKPWDKAALHPIEKAIHDSKLGIAPMNDGKVIRISLPPLTEERRKDLVKVLKGMAENHRVAVRNIRRDAVESARALAKKKSLPEDDAKRAEAQIQKLTDQHVARVDELAAGKEKEILTV